MLYTFKEKGGEVALVSCRPDRFERHGSFSVDGHGQSWAHPVVANSRLYLRYAENLYCFDLRRK